MLLRIRSRPTDVYGTAAIKAGKALLAAALFGVAVTVAYSRYYLGYHTASQVICGSALGIVAGAAWYILTVKVLVSAPPPSLPPPVPRSWGFQFFYVTPVAGGYHGAKLLDQVYSPVFNTSWDAGRASHLATFLPRLWVGAGDEHRAAG